MIARAFALVALAALLGCESVPPAYFDAPPDGGTDAGDGGGDANSTDALTEEAGCPDAAATFTCCGTVLCSGPDCTTAACGKCEQSCKGASQICCPRPAPPANKVDCPTFAQGC